MNKQDAKVYKALAEAGFEYGHDIPTKDLDRIFDTITHYENLMLEQTRILFDVQDKDVDKFVDSASWEDVDLSDKTERTKKAVRIKNNKALSKMLDKFKFKYQLKKINKILNNDDIPDYEVGIVIGSRHVNYHNNGFTGGECGLDTKKGMNLEEAFWFVTDHKNKRKNIREEINQLLK